MLSLAKCALGKLIVCWRCGFSGISSCAVESVILPVAVAWCGTSTSYSYGAAPGAAIIPRFDVHVQHSGTQICLVLLVPDLPKCGKRVWCSEQHFWSGLHRKECRNYISHPGLKFSDDLDSWMVWFTKAW